MILQALTEYYEQLAQQGLVARPGWGPAKVSYGIDLNEDGSICQILTLLQLPESDKKGKLIPREFSVPLPFLRPGQGVKANFLCDNSGYIFGIDNKGKPDRSKDCFDDSRKLHERILTPLKSKAAKAVCNYFKNWNRIQGPMLEETAALWEKLTSGCNLLFFYDGHPVMDDLEIRAAWQEYYDSLREGVKKVCLITGQPSVIPKTHSTIKGVPGSQSSGAALVSFNAAAFESLGCKQNDNSPIGEYAAFAYTTALNYLIADFKNRTVIGDTVVLCWAKCGDPAYQEMAMDAMMGADSDELAAAVRSAVIHLARGERFQWDTAALDPAMEFYVLGIAPNAARLSVRFFQQNSFGGFMQNLQAHYERLDIVKPRNETRETIPLWQLLAETNRDRKSNAAPPQLAGDVLRSILTGCPYPATLLNAISLRVRADKELSFRRAAILKAYYSRNKHEKCPEEVLTVALNENSTNTPYVLGRLFSILELIQQAANPGINATIRDKYFNAAAASPSRVFPLLLNLSEKHLRKLDSKLKIWLEKQRASVTEKLPEAFPDRLGLPEQGAFQLGYYHQTQKRYEKKGD